VAIAACLHFHIAGWYGFMCCTLDDGSTSAASLGKQRQCQTYLPPGELVGLATNAQVKLLLAPALIMGWPDHFPVEADYSHDASVNMGCAAPTCGCPGPSRLAVLHRFGRWCSDRGK
jgi:hypothetical protein